MAINLTGFLGGLGEGFDSYAKEKRQRQAEDRANALEALRERRQDESMSQGIYAKIADLTKQDALDEQETLKRLRLPTIDAEAKAQEMEARRQRHENTKTMIEQLSAQPGVTKMFGNTATLLRPSMIAGPGFKMPTAEVDPTRAFELIQKERQRIEGITNPGVDKASMVAQSRNFLSSIIPKSMLDQWMPEYGASQGYGRPTAPAKVLEDPTKFFAENQGFKVGEGGERVLPTGAKQRVFYKDGVPMVEYAPELKANYESPDVLAARAKLVSEQARRLEGLYDPTIRKAQADAALSEWKGKLAGKQFEWFDRVQGAKVHKDMMAKAGSGASDALRRMSILLAHQDRVAGLNQRDQQFQQMMGYRGAGLNLQSQALMQKAKQDFINNYQTLQKSFMAAKQLAGSSTDKAMGGSQKAALENMNALGQQLQQMQGQFQALSAGDTQLAGQLAGVGGSASMIDPSALMAGGQTGQAGQIDPNMLMQMMMAQGGGRQQQAPQQAPIVFSPQIFAGGQPGMMGGMQGGAMDQATMIKAIMDALGKKGVVQTGTDANGNFIPAGKAGSVFPTVKALTDRISKIRSSLGLTYLDNARAEELAYKYPLGFPKGVEGDMLRATLKANEEAAARKAPQIRKDAEITAAHAARIKEDKGKEIKRFAQGSAAVPMSPF